VAGGCRLRRRCGPPGGELTPPGSACSIIFGTGVTSAAPGSAQGLHLVVTDIDAARAELIDRGADVGEVFHDAGGVFHHAGTVERVPGPAPDHKSYGSCLVQQPGRQRLGDPGDHHHLPGR
jgi:hypothetical protein